MGAWSHEPFGNDTACDWAYDLENTHDLSLIEQAFDEVLDLGTDDYLDSYEGSHAVAAAEVLAKLLGKGTQTDGYTSKIDAWVQSIHIQPSETLLKKAQQALTRIMTENSELQELWGETDDYNEWVNSINTLQAALSST
ncbi:DUF4259 domain-containing protein [Thiofilum flexile]|uniref:DUF4259 domain-containing protein n=1 Tax=Thiofilum flexile TaxID=125627 RepID=UPI000368A15F|nr:DUF4259 domain-containing protein [Thiofilum flexile]